MTFWEEGYYRGLLNYELLSLSLSLSRSFFFFGWGGGGVGGILTGEKGQGGGLELRIRPS
jgi:hypothetical protein